MAFELFDDILKPLPVTAKLEFDPIIRDTPTQAQAVRPGGSAVEELRIIEDQTVVLARERQAEAESDLEERRAFNERAAIEGKAAQVEGAKVRAASVAALDKFDRVGNMNPFVRSALVIAGRGDLNLSTARTAADTATQRVNVFNQGEAARVGFNLEQLDRMDAIDAAEDAALAAKSETLTARAAARITQLGVGDTIARKNQIELDNVTTTSAIEEGARRRILVGSGTAFLTAEVGKLKASGKTFTEIDGISIGVGDLNNQIQANLTRDANVKALLAAKQVGAADSIGVFEDNMITNMTRDDIIEAQNFDGQVAIPTPEGQEQRFIQLPQSKLTTAFISKTEAENAQIEIKTGEAAAIEGIQDQLRGLNEFSQGVARRSGIAFGENNIPRRLQKVIAENNIMVATTLGSAVKDEQGNARFTRTQTTGFARNMNKAEAEIEAEIQRGADLFSKPGSPINQGLAAFQLGDPLSPDVSFQALQDMSITGPPPNVPIDSPARAGLDAGRAVMIEFANQGLDEDGTNALDVDDPDFQRRFFDAMINKTTGKNKLDEPGIKASVARAIYEGYAGALWGDIFSTLRQGAANNPVITDIPDSFDENGNPLTTSSPHAFGVLDETDYQAVLLASSNAGDALTREAGEALDEFNVRVARRENDVLIRELELLPLTPTQRQIHKEQGFTTFADSMIAWMGTESFDEILGRVEVEQRESSFPSFLMQNGVNTAGRLAPDLRENVKGLTQIKGQARTKLLADRADRAALYASPVVRARTIVGAIAQTKGIGDRDVERLIEAVDDVIDLTASLLVGQQGRTQGLNQAAPLTFDNVILNQRFDDPEIEKIRKAIAPELEAQARFMDLGLARLDERRRDEERQN